MQHPTPDTTGHGGLRVPVPQRHDAHVLRGLHGGQAVPLVPQLAPTPGGGTLARHPYPLDVVAPTIGDPGSSLLGHALAAQCAVHLLPALVYEPVFAPTAADHGHHLQHQGKAKAHR